jgi:hypothetical protein
MASPLPTPELQQVIVAYIRAGGFAHVAAEAAGVPRERFGRWLELGGRARGRKEYRLFREAVRQAQAQARLAAEIAVFKNRPLDWLKCGPGKDAPAYPGWSTAAKPQPVAGANRSHSLADPLIQELIQTMLQRLTPFPEARAALAQALLGLPEVSSTVAH